MHVPERRPPLRLQLVSVSPAGAAPRDDAVRLLGAADVRRLLARADVRPLPRRGQNFVADPNTVRRIVALADVRPGERVLEIGVGLGSLTLGLVAAGADVVGLEVDERLAAVARSLLGERARVVVQDATKADWAALLGDEPGSWKMVSNLPYSVGTPLLADLLDGVPQIGRFFVMVQREVGERLVAGPGGEAYGALSVKVAFHCEARIAGSVPPGVFVPRPDVASVLVVLARRDRPPVDCDPARFFAVVRAGFAQRRKGLRGALGARWEKRDVDAALARAGIEATRRAETLGLAEFAALAEALP